MKKVVAASIGFGILFAYYMLGIHRDPPAPFTVTVSRLKNLTRAVYLCETRFNQPILTLLEERYGSESSIKTRLGRFLADNHDYLNVPTNFIYTTLLYDGWGASIEVGLTTEIIVTNDAAWSALSGCGIAIWSVGKNGINEFGKGDDMLWPGISYITNFDTPHISP